MRRKTEAIRRYFMQRVDDLSGSPVLETANRFKMSRQAVNKHVQALISEGLVQTEGESRYLKYSLTSRLLTKRTYQLSSELEEHRIWSECAEACVQELPEEDRRICEYGFTEMVNNAIDHSEGKQLVVSVSLTEVSIRFVINDDGIGIFKKIANALKLPDERQSLLELSKGKFTTDPARHTGEGIFFTSRVFDVFCIVSGGLSFLHDLELDDWLVPKAGDPEQGTSVLMRLTVPTKRTLKSVFDSFSSGPEEYSFSKTHVPLSLALVGSDNLVSRSQARRVLSRVENFKEVILDFANVPTVGQAFADEIFRVYSLAHPEVNISVTSANEQVQAMISRARGIVFVSKD